MHMACAWLVAMLHRLQWHTMCKLQRLPLESVVSSSTTAHWGRMGGAPGVEGLGWLAGLLG